MEDVLTIILTSVISVLFLVFVIATYREMANMDKSGYKTEGEIGGPRAELLNLLIKLVEEKDARK